MGQHEFAQNPQWRCAWLGTLALFSAASIAAALWYGSPMLPGFSLHYDYKSTTGVGDPSKNVTMIFSEHDDYQNLSHTYDHLWDDLLTPNGGFLMVTEADQSETAYGISMFHQLHCLQMIRGAIQNLQRRADKNLPEDRAEDSDHAQPPHTHTGLAPSHQDPDHWEHCLDYLRQTIICNADSTIEPPNGPTAEAIDGMGERKCRDWQPLRALALGEAVPVEELGVRVQ